MEQAEINRRTELYARSVYSRLSLLTTPQLEERHLWLLWSRSKFSGNGTNISDLLIQAAAGPNLEFNFRSYFSSPNGFAVSVVFQDSAIPGMALSSDVRRFLKDTLHTAVRAIGVDPSMQSSNSFRLDFASYDTALRMLCFFDELILGLLGLLRGGERPRLIDPANVTVAPNLIDLLRQHKVRCLLNADGKLIR